MHTTTLLTTLTAALLSLTLTRAAPTPAPQDNDDSETLPTFTLSPDAFDAPTVNINLFSAAGGLAVVAVPQTGQPTPNGDPDAISQVVVAGPANCFFSGADGSFFRVAEADGPTDVGPPTAITSITCF